MYRKKHRVVKNGIRYDEAPDDMILNSSRAAVNAERSSKDYLSQFSE